MKYFILMIVSCLILSGCAGLADYTISLENGYRIDRLSAHQIQIYGEDAVNDGDETTFNHLYVPAKVAAVWWNEQYIIAKQLHLKSNGRGVEEPPKKPSDADYSYWIIEMNKNEVKGPLTLKELESDSEQLGINVVFTPIEKLKKEP
ncbi:DUF3997 domain-containing protein [Solibacillus merdavium]|uniref:DUF3997 domain-containing protein n=1 Tax=Solibacillus merdavium TaxID=2762218 RepID=A0ABR8XRQ8_9BACL|nr:DUF3997 domain-containing protein [Solibacillus merdavium]MBD8034635.1 DUF3997 domain-containing protein [Solibacillus merdavium]